MPFHRIAVHGIGMVGTPLANYFEGAGFDVRRFDPPKGLDGALADCELHFLCVPTPFVDGKGFDRSYLGRAMKTIAQARGDLPTVVVIKSTVVPGTTKSVQEAYPRYTILFNPEFLTEKNADAEMRAPDRQVLGYVTDEGKAVCEEVMAFLPDAPYQAIMQASEAELVKYFGNCFLTAKVIFANLIYDFCEKLGVDYEAVAEAVGHDKRIGHSHLDVMHGGYRGYGGSCFPKDIRAFIERGEALGVDVGLLKEVERRNNELVGK